MWQADWQRTLFSSLVQAGEVSPWRKLEPDYISALLAEPHIEQLILARPDPQAPLAEASLLQMLLRHALLQEIAYAAARLQADETGADLTALLRDAEQDQLEVGEGVLEVAAEMVEGVVGAEPLVLALAAGRARPLPARII